MLDDDETIVRLIADHLTPTDVLNVRMLSHGLRRVCWHVVHVASERTHGDVVPWIGRGHVHYVNRNRIRICFSHGMAIGLFFEGIEGTDSDRRLNAIEIFQGHVCVFCILSCVIVPPIDVFLSGHSLARFLGCPFTVTWQRLKRWEHGYL